MQAEDKKIDDAISQMKQANEAITNYVYEFEEFDLDLAYVEEKIIIPKDKLHERILHHSYKYNAIEDTLIILKKSLENGTLSLHDYISSIR